MKRARLFIVTSLLLGLSGVASASKISVAGSTYGPLSPTSVVDFVNGDLNEQYYEDSDATNEVFVFQINADINNPTLTVDAPGSSTFIADDTLNPPSFLGFGTFVGTSCPAFSTTLKSVLCGPDPNVVLSDANSTPPSSDGSQNTVSFSGNGDGKGLTFFVVLPQSAVFSSTCSSAGTPCLPTATLTAASVTTPEPALGPVLAIAFCGLLVAVRLRRSAKVA